MSEINHDIKVAIERDPNAVPAVVDEAIDGKKAIPAELVTKSSDNSTFKQIGENNPLPIRYTATVKEAFSGAANVTKTFSEPMHKFAIFNDGSSNLTFTINGITIEVKTQEGFSESFNAFTAVDVVTTSAFRAYVG